MRSLLLLLATLSVLLSISLDFTYAQSLKSVPALLAKDETRPEPSHEAMPTPDYRPAREIKQFTEPTVVLRGTAEDVGLDGRSLAGLLGTRFLGDFAFLQSDFAFDKTYETWEIGLFECEAWTVGKHYPIAFHVQCTAGSMDEPRHWRSATLGYGPRDKIVETVRSTLDSIVAEYAGFVRKARGASEDGNRR